ncbi:uncharacterized protein IAS62_000705 [Cryptococcus decagattii]|uniref:Uncharacterized protein n=1 Tax=Cryptococcus decagattii TaxID=1859122 RepID=A0ABZ2ALK5_9TREE
MKPKDIYTFTPLKRRIRQAAQSVGDYFNDEKMSQYPILTFLSNKLDRPPSVLAHSFLLLLLSGVLFNPYHFLGGYRPLGILWPTWSTVAHIPSPHVSSDAKDDSTSQFRIRAKVRTDRKDKEWSS